MNPLNLARVFEGDLTGYMPCTPAAVMEIVKHFNIDVKGKKVAVLGRSMVVGKPLAMMMLKEDATVTICHSKTENLQEVVSDADIVAAAIGKAKFINSDYIKEGAVVIDVGINVDENGKLCGDVDFEDVKDKASFITPVPGGVGSVTTAVLLKNVIKGAELIR
jgi:methylenetetrahydrofolate dehydrogenase (NADP+)/methenyltetrahydrofolate cyclohydrolase